MANRESNKTVDEHGAAVLLGITPPEVRWFSRVLGLGHKEGGNPSQVLFTYDELRRLSSVAAASSK